MVSSFFNLIGRKKNRGHSFPNDLEARLIFHTLLKKTNFRELS